MSFVPCAALHDTINAHWVPLGAALMANAAPLCWLPQWFNSSWQQVTRSRPFLRKLWRFFPMSIWECGASHCLKTRFYPAWQTILRAVHSIGPVAHHFHARQPSPCCIKHQLLELLAKKGQKWFRASEFYLWCKNLRAHLALSLWPHVITVFLFTGNCILIFYAYLLFIFMFGNRQKELWKISTIWDITNYSKRNNDLLSLFSVVIKCYQ